MSRATTPAGRQRAADPGLAPLSFGSGGDRWDLIDPQRIATTCSARHVQSVLEDARATIRLCVASLRVVLQLPAVGGTAPGRKIGIELLRIVGLAAGESGAPLTVPSWVYWHSCDAPADRPDADLDVLLGFGDETESIVGAWTGDDWIGTQGEPLDPPPLFWAPMPTGPFKGAARP